MYIKVFFILLTLSAVLFSQTIAPLKLRLLDKHENGIVHGLILRDAGDLGVTTIECNIDTYSGISMKKFRIIEAGDSTFTITKDNVAKTFAINDLRKLAFIKHGFWKGFAWGAGGTLVLTAILLATAGHGGDMEGLGQAILLFGGLLAAAPIGAIVGFISEFTTSDEVYYFDRINSEAKAKRLKYLILKYKD